MNTAIWPQVHILAIKQFTTVFPFFMSTIVSQMKRQLDLDMALFRWPLQIDCLIRVNQTTLTLWCPKQISLDFPTQLQPTFPIFIDTATSKMRQTSTTIFQNKRHITFLVYNQGQFLMFRQHQLFTFPSYLMLKLRCIIEHTTHFSIFLEMLEVSNNFWPSFLVYWLFL